MKLKNTSIQHRLNRIILFTSAAALVLTCLSYTVYEYLAYSAGMKGHLSTLGEIIAANTVDALNRGDQGSVQEVLSALKAERRLVKACIYDRNGHVVSTLPLHSSNTNFPSTPGEEGYRFGDGHLEGFQPIMLNGQHVGTLYLQSTLSALYSRLRLYGLIALGVIAVTFLLTYIFSRRLQRSVTQPILDLAATAEAISVQGDYTVRAAPSSVYEAQVLTEAFNHMLEQIEKQNRQITSFNQQLEEKIDARTRELQEANRELERSNQSLEQFAYVASHDLQEPLRKIQTFSELSEKNLHSLEIVKRYLQKITSSATRMSELVRAILNYSRLRNDQPFEPIDLNATLEAVRTDLELVISEKKAVIESDHLPTIHGMPLQISQLFFNLVSNALKFSVKPPVVHIGASVTDGVVQLTFRDNGIGFEQQYASKIFTIFQRLHQPKDYAGTGIGLALCKRIVDNHRGRITVVSEPGVGTTFTVCLPLPGRRLS